MLTYEKAISDLIEKFDEHGVYLGNQNRWAVDVAFGAMIDIAIELDKETRKNNMFIVKEGDLSRLVEEKTFECTACGCVFVANNTEYTKQIDYRNGTYAECKCPCCERLVIWYPGGK